MIRYFDLLKMKSLALIILCLSFSVACSGEFNSTRLAQLTGKLSDDLPQTHLADHHLRCLIVFVYQQQYKGSGALVTLNGVLTVVQVTKDFANDVSRVQAYYDVAASGINSFRSITSISNVINNDNLKIVKLARAIDPSTTRSEPVCVETQDVHFGKGLFMEWHLQTIANTVLDVRQLGDYIYPEKSMVVRKDCHRDGAFLFYRQKLVGILQGYLSDPAHYPDLLQLRYVKVGKFFSYINVMVGLTLNQKANCDFISAE